MRQFWRLIVATLVIWPVGWEAMAIGDKPIDLIPADLLPVCMPLIYLLARTKPTKMQLSSITKKARAAYLLPVLSVIFIIYSMSLAGIGLGLSGEYVRLFSAFKMAKPFGFVLLGVLLGTWLNPFEFIESVGQAYGVIVAMTMFFTLTDPFFPFGEWGKHLFEYELAGYPNSPMSFYGCLVPLLLAWADSSRQFLFKLVIWSLAGCSALMILGSMSRSSTIVLVCGVSFYLVMTGRTALLVVSIAGIMALSAIGFGLFSALRDTEMMTVLMDRVQTRLERSVGNDDPSSGRFEIWQLAIELWAESPVVGHLFESFSHFSEYDTPHQQYLEVLHKCGGIGLVLYVGALAACLTNTSRLLRMSKVCSTDYWQLQAVRAMLVGLLIGNLTQPNLTYSLTGNCVFLLFGCLCTPRAVYSVTKPHKLDVAKPIKPAPVPMLRIAG